MGVSRFCIGSGSVQGSDTSEKELNYYEAQRSWPLSGKYHKTNFLYRELPEDINPENIGPECDTVLDASETLLGGIFAEAIRNLDRSYSNFVCTNSPRQQD